MKRFLHFSLFVSSFVLSATLFSFENTYQDPLLAKNKTDPLLASKRRYEVTGPKRDRPGYLKIQDAIEAARSEGASASHPAVVVVDSGKYEENLTLYDGIEIEGPDGELLVAENQSDLTVEIKGTHILPQTGAVVLKNLTLQMSPSSEKEGNFGFKKDLHVSKKGETQPKSLIIPPTERTNPADTNSGGGGGGSISAVLGTAPINVVTTLGGVATVSLTGVVSPSHGGTGVANSDANTLAWSGGTGNFTFPGGGTMVTFPSSGTLATTSQIPTLPVTVPNGGTGATTFTANGILLGNGTAAIQQTNVGGVGQILLGSGGAPAFHTPTAGAGLTLTANATTFEYALSTPVSVPNGGTGATTLTLNGLLLGNGTMAVQNVGVGGVGQILLGSGGAPAFHTPTAGAGLTLTANATTFEYALSTPVSVPNGGTGATTLTLNGLLLGNGTMAVQNVGVGSVGQILLGSGGAPTFHTPTAGAGLTLTANATTFEYALDGSAALQTLTGNDGTPVSPTVGNIDVIGTSQRMSAEGSTVDGGGIFFTANPDMSTSTLRATWESFGTDNTFLGIQAGNNTLSGSENAAFGQTALSQLTMGSGNTGIGFQALIGTNTGSNNIGIGLSAGANYSSGSGNIAIGHQGSPTDNNICRIGDNLLETYISGNHVFMTDSCSCLAVGFFSDVTNATNGSGHFGENNTISGNSQFVTGMTNAITMGSLSAILGGSSNSINTGTGCGVLASLSSTATGNYSSVLSGSSASVAGDRSIGCSRMNLTGNDSFAFGRGTFAGTGSVFLTDQASVYSETLDQTLYARFTNGADINQFLVDTDGTTTQPAGQIIQTRSVSGSDTVGTDDYIVFCDSSGGAFTLTLMASPETGRTFEIKDTVGQAGTNNITITPTAGMIEGQSSYLLNSNYGSVTVTYSGTQWSVLPSYQVNRLDTVTQVAAIKNSSTGALEPANTSAIVSTPYAVGAVREIIYNTLCSNVATGTAAPNWSSFPMGVGTPDGTINLSPFLTINTGPYQADGRGLLYTCPVNLDAGVYMVSYYILAFPAAPFIDIAVTIGGSPVSLHSQFDAFCDFGSGVFLPMTDYFTVTADNSTFTMSWVANGQNPSATGFVVILGACLRIVKIG